MYKSVFSLTRYMNSISEMSMDETMVYGVPGGSILNWIKNG